MLSSWSEPLRRGCIYREGVIVLGGWHHLEPREMNWVGAEHSLLLAVKGSFSASEGRKLVRASQVSGVRQPKAFQDLECRTAPRNATYSIDFLCRWYLLKSCRYPPGSPTGIMSHPTCSCLGGRSIISLNSLPYLGPPRWSLHMPPSHCFKSNDPDTHTPNLRSSLQPFYMIMVTDRF